MSLRDTATEVKVRSDVWTVGLSGKPRDVVSDGLSLEATGSRLLIDRATEQVDSYTQLTHGQSTQEGCR